MSRLVGPGLGGNPTIVWRGEEWMRAAQPAIDHGLTGAAQVFADTAVRQMQLLGRKGAASKIDLHTGKKAGKIAGTSWIASKPGEFPGVRTSLLRNSIVAVSPAALGTPGRAAYGTATKYGRYLQLGTRGPGARQLFSRAGGTRGVRGGRIAPRPWATLTIPLGRDKASRVFVATAAADLKAAGRSI